MTYSTALLKIASELLSGSLMHENAAEVVALCFPPHLLFQDPACPLP